MKQIFRRSVEEKKLWYATYLGDRDSKTYQDVVILDPYPGIIIEYIRHVQKRIGSRLRSLNNNTRDRSFQIKRGFVV